MNQEERVRYEELESQAEELVHFVDELLEDRKGFLTQEDYDEALAKLDTAYLLAQTEVTKEAAKRFATEIKTRHRGV